MRIHSVKSGHPTLTLSECVPQEVGDGQLGLARLDGSDNLKVRAVPNFSCTWMARSLPERTGTVLIVWELTPLSSMGFLHFDEPTLRGSKSPTGRKASAVLVMPALCRSAEVICRVGCIYHPPWTAKLMEKATARVR